jgi:hypothetical protein
LDLEALKGREEGKKGRRREEGGREEGKKGRRREEGGGRKEEGGRSEHHLLEAVS